MSSDCLLVLSPVPGQPYINFLWANKAAFQRFGKAFTTEARMRLVDGFPLEKREYLIKAMQLAHQHIVVRLLSGPRSVPALKM